MKDFRDKVVVITGAGSGMGRAYAQEFGRLGAKLALNDFNAAALAETVAEQQAQGVAVCSAVFDVASRADFEAFAEQVKAELGNAHVIINNAGIEGAVKPVWAMSPAEIERIMGINFYGVVHGTQVFLPQLFANNEGAVVNVSSIFGLVGTPNAADYCASKFAVRGFTEALMVELEESPVDAYLVHPGGIATNIVQKNEGQDFNKRYLVTPPEDIARYLVSCLRRRQLKVVYGHGARKTWLGSNFLPQALMNRVLWRELKPFTDLSAYPFAKSGR